MAAFIKKEFDKKYSPTWHCIVGRNFGALSSLCKLRYSRWKEAIQGFIATAGSYVTHETKHFIYFYLGECNTLYCPFCVEYAALPASAIDQMYLRNRAKCTASQDK